MRADGVPRATDPGVGATPWAARSGGPSAAEYALVATLSLAVTVGTALRMGRDLNWDYLNYHAYAALLALQDRLSQDYFAAGVQGYLNPLPYLPLGAMQAMGWPALAITSALAAIQSLNLLFLYLVSRLLLGGETVPRRVGVAAATVLGGATGVLWTQAGSSFVDATLAPLVLAALWLLLRNPGWAGLVGAGMLVGAGTGLKWTIVPYAVAIWLAAAALPGPAGARVHRLLLVGTGALAGFALAYGYWGWRLFEAFGSPVFPLFNTVFQAPDYPLHSDQFRRFVPDSLVALLALPFRMAGHDTWVYAEVPLPDLRPALAIVLLAAGMLPAGLRRLRGRAGGAAPAGRQPPWPVAPTSDAGFAAWPVLTVFFVVSLLLWVQTSSNGRYATPTFLLLGPIVWALLERLVGARAGRTIGLLVVCLQIVHLLHAGSIRFSPQPWSREMLSVELPASLALEPGLFVTLGSLSDSHLAAHVHPRSAFTNPIGMYSLPTDGPGWERFVALRDRWAGRTRVVFKVEPQAEPVSPGQLARVDQLIERLGLSLEVGDCPGILVRAAEGGDERRLVACAVRPRASADAELARQRELARRITDALQARCPRYFQPPAPQVEGSRGSWSRRYNRHDLFVFVNFDEDEISFRQERQPLALPIGRVSTWARDVEAFACRLPHGGRRDMRTLGPESP